VTATEQSAAVSHGSGNSLRSNLQKKEIPSLYGLRGVAALAVVVWHYLDQWHLTYLFPGPFAVTLFFELSGLLITWLLLNEKERTGTVTLRDFYLRRALRLFPVFYAVWALCRWSGDFPGSWAYFFYLGDYYTALTQHYGTMTQAWSLGVEEKFYLLWPLLVRALPVRVLMRGAVFVLVAEPIYRFALVEQGHQIYTWFAFDCRLDPLLVGCVIALLVKRGWDAPRWLAHPLTPWVALALIFALQSVSDAVTYLLTILLVSVICRPSQFLNNPVMRYLGAISYSLYLIHPYVREAWWPRVAALVPGEPMPVVLAGQVALAMAGATLLHFTIERPFLVLKKYLHGNAVNTQMH
jgi:peptidoglycan/LPS O-acetylase OafA/YrhL